jgi:hypothetical protein
MTTPEQFEQKLQQQYQHEKAKHVLSEQGRRKIVRQAQRLNRHRWLHHWRNIQLVLSCVFVMVLGFLLLTTPKTAPMYYKIVVTSDEQYREVQQHQISAQSDLSVAKLANPGRQAYQHYRDLTQLGAAFHRHIGLLRQNDDQWQISVCNDLLLTIDRQLLQLVKLSQPVADYQQLQWVEFIRDDAGQLLAITPSSAALQCPQT